jgi:hypothetical protein
MKRLATLAAAFVLTATPVPALAQAGNAKAAELAKANLNAKMSFEFLVATAKTIKDPALASVTLGILANPAPTFLARLPDAAAREAVRKALKDAGLIDGTVTVEALFPPIADASKAPQAFWASAGSITRGHHDNPGGLAEHTAFNLQAALDLEKNYRGRYDIRTLDRDALVAATILHDSMKPWILQWQKDGSLPVQPVIGGTSSHHIIGVAEGIHRGLSTELVVTLAAAHNPPGTEPQMVIGFLRAASIFAGVDPVERGYLKKNGEKFELARLPSIEGTIHHLSDQEWVIGDTQVQNVEAALERLARADAKGKDLGASQIRWMANRVKSRIPPQRLYQALRDGGDAGLAAALAKAKIPLIDAGDVPPEG